MRLKQRKYIVVLGSLMSGLGKGIVTASIGKLLQSRGLKVSPIKFDGYLNVDCGTMNPFRHGEVFVLDDGTECDMDFGTYERFLNADLSSANSITGGKLFRNIIEKERRGGFLGRDVQIVPHLTDEIKGWVRRTGQEQDADVVIVEVGGTVGDLENGYFLEAMRQLAAEERVLFVQLTWVPSMSEGEPKTKPTQHANKLIQSMGILPKIIICRQDEPLSREAREKISMFCNVPPSNVFDDPDVATIYELPLILERQKMTELLLSELGIEEKDEDMKEWRALVERIKSPKREVSVAITGKYTAVKDAYVSIKEALVHAGAATATRANIKWVETSEIEDGKASVRELLSGCDGIIVPGGYGSRGVEGKIACVKYARENGMPFLGLCYGLQMAVIEWARNKAGMEKANTTEVDEKTPYPVIDFLPEQREVREKGGNQRLGAWPCRLKRGTRAYEAYGKEEISERHRHRYEVNNDYRERLERSGLVVSGTSPDGSIVEMVEWPDGWGVGTQAHPELKSRLERPAPLFVAFLKACAEFSKKG
ncbi:MAG: CTP synthase [Candidatus Micrarchaeota archaeon]|nr:CTP synthase [Candidatus Micrarchaeota archaeon]